MRKSGLTPLILTVIGYILGILLGNFFIGAKYFWFLIIFLSLFALASVFYFIFQRNPGTIALVFSILAFLSLGITRHLRARLLPPDEISHYISFPTPKRTHLTGVVVSIPKEASEKINFVLACERLTIDKREIVVTGRTQVFLYTSETTEINYGDRLSISGRLSAPPASTNPGLFDYQRYLSYRNVHSLFSVYNGEDIERLGKARIGIFRSIISKIRKRIDYIIKSNLPQLESSILAGVMLGERGGLPRQIQGIFADAGVLHTLAVSGLHVGLVLFIFYAFFQVLGIPKKTTYFLTIIVVIVYAQVAGGRPSAIRASIMATCGLVAILLERDKHLYNSLALAAFIILLFNPFTLFDVGFQLSFMATMGILYLTPHFLDYFRFGKPRKVITYILTSLAVSAGALVGVYPIIAFYFNKISLIALVSNILVVPQVAVVIALGFASSILGLFSLGIAQVVNVMNRLFIIILFGCIRFFASLPFSFKYVVSPSLIFLLTYYLFFIFLPKIKTSRFARRILVFFPLIFLFSITGRNIVRSKNLLVTFLDVGQGDAIHLRLPKRRDILIDGGGTIGKFDIGEKVVIPYLLKNGISKLDTIFLTHPHYNHIGGLVPILKKFKVKRVYYNSQNYADDLVDEFLRVIGERKIPLKHISYGEKVEYDDAKLCILNPRIMKENIDSNSLVIKLSYGDFGILFTGDIDYEVQEELSKEEIESDILQIPNHGKGLISPKFLYKVAPKYGIISTKFQVRKLEEKYSNIRFFSTSKNGAIVIKTDGESFEIEPMREGEH
ncbi:MAG: DNA internalization-related competence protein ComEC/Rec2 [bacterium]